MKTVASISAAAEASYDEDCHLPRTGIDPMQYCELHAGHSFAAIDPNAFAPGFGERLSEYMQIMRGLPRVSLRRSEFNPVYCYESLCRGRSSVSKET
ncbi:hypothetical protein FBUS_01381 [Fasciolopsis buskii]|uniref:Uncharacterized protein n=1 Tax=Fasciolopsis buskii TaxID=27845 RepID=A0A8E0SAQ3_9TREM|nr:hypothetical protein FBUS_01381 [Fasciolopsis buski]